MNIEQLYNTIATACGMNTNSSLISNVSPLQQQQAMNTLQSMESTSGYVTTLIQILDTQGINSDCKLFICLLIKNIVKRQWNDRGGKLTALSSEEKFFVKRFVLQQSAEESKKVVLQLSIIIAKIARNDWPDNWVELFPTLFSIIQTKVDSENFKVIRYNGMLFLQEVLQELSTKTLSFAKTSYSTLCTDLFPIVYSLWLETQMLLSQQLSSLKQIITNQIPTTLHLDVFRLDISFNLDFLASVSCIITLLLEHGFSSIATIANSVTEYFAMFGTYVQTLLEFLRDSRLLLYSSGMVSAAQGSSISTVPNYISSTTLPEDSSGTSNIFGHLVIIVSSVKNVVRILSAQPVKLQKLFPLDMAMYLEAFLNFYVTQLSSECEIARQISTNVDSCFSISAVLFLSNTLRCAAYCPTQHASSSSPSDSNPPVSVSQKVSLMMKKLNKPKLSSLSTFDDEDEADKRTATAAGNLRIAFFNSDTTSRLLDLCLTQLLRYDSIELQDWNTDPEHFFVSQSSLTEADSLKTASESLFLGLLDIAPSPVLTRLVNLIQDVPAQLSCVSSPSTASTVQFWDAIYLCVGLGVSGLAQHINPGEWLTQALGKLIQEVLQQPQLGSLPDEQQLLRARFMWLMSCWMYHWDSGVLVAVSQLVLTVLNPSSCSDLVVKLTCIQTLDSVLRCEAFSPNQFLSLLQPLVEGLCYLISELEDNDSRTKVVELIGELTCSMQQELRNGAATTLLPPLVGYLGSVWNSCKGDSNILRVSLLEVSNATSVYRIELNKTC